MPRFRRLSLRSRGVRISLALVVLGAAAWAQARWRASADVSPYVTAPVSRGAVVRTITTTGAVDPVITVEVGAYVSGTIRTLSCDFNTQVKAGQLCAKIDPSPYQVVVDQDTASLGTAQAQLNKDQASLAYAKINYGRDARLLEHGVTSQDTVDSDKSVYAGAQAQVQLDQATIRQREADLHAANVNLAYTDIASPVDGTVVSRNVTMGQTVAASFQTPTLFLIAQDLTKMQVDTNVSESDVGAAKVGQRATFTVEAYPNRTFTGQVVQVREAPITVQNVVTYNVVVAVDNSDLALLPGMTANTRIITDERDDVVRVPVQALRFAPHGVEHAASTSERKPGEHKRDSHVQVLRDGRLAEVPVTIGLNDGSFAEVVHGELQPDEPVVVDEKGAGGHASQGAGTPAARRGIGRL
jgi:HlyD family secretion protein